MNSNKKGKRGELEAAKAMASVLGVPLHRTQQFKGTPQSADIEGKEDVIGLHLEVKRTERLSVYAALGQAEEDAGENCPVVLHRRNRSRWVAIMYLSDLPEVSDIVQGIRNRDQPTMTDTKKLLWEV